MEAPLKICIFCYKTTDLRSGLFCETKVTILSRFFTLICRQFKNHNGKGWMEKSLEQKLAYMLSGENGGLGSMQVCQDCVQIVEGYCDLYHQMKCLELRVNFQIDKLWNVMWCAEKDGAYRNLKADILLGFRKTLMRLCKKYQKESAPRIILPPVYTNVELDFKGNAKKNIWDTAVAQGFFLERQPEAGNKTSLEHYDGLFKGQHSTTTRISGNRWKCHFCGLIYSSKMHWKNHKEHVHLKGVSSATCSICSKSFANRTFLKIHDIHFHIEKYFMDAKLKFVSGDKFGKYVLDIVNKNIISNHGYQCQICSVNLCSKKSATNHVVLLHRNIIKGNLERLQWSMEPGKLTNFTSILLRDAGKHHCRKCQRTFPDAFRAQDHFNTHHPEWTFSSSKLPSLSIEQFRSYVIYLIQQEVSKFTPAPMVGKSGKTGLQCPYCSKRLSRKERARTHVMHRHHALLAEKVERLQRHMTIYEVAHVNQGRKYISAPRTKQPKVRGKPPYNCRGCSKQFNHSANLDRHEAFEHPETFFMCSKSQHVTTEEFTKYVCHLIKKESKLFAATVDGVTGKIKYKCPHCVKFLSERHYIPAHAIIVHENIFRKKLEQLQGVNQSTKDSKSINLSDPHVTRHRSDTTAIAKELPQSTISENKGYQYNLRQRTKTKSNLQSPYDESDRDEDGSSHISNPDTDTEEWERFSPARQESFESTEEKDLTTSPSHVYDDDDDELEAKIIDNFGGKEMDHGEGQKTTTSCSAESPEPKPKSVPPRNRKRRPGSAFIHCSTRSKLPKMEQTSKNSTGTSNKKWKCNLNMCGALLSTKYHLKIHKERMHLKSKRGRRRTSSCWTCSICSKVYASNKELLKHSVYLHIESLFMSSKLKSVSINQFRKYIFYLLNNSIESCGKPKESETDNRQFIKYKCTFCLKPLCSKGFARVHVIQQHKTILKRKLQKLQQTMKPEDVRNVPVVSRERKVDAKCFFISNAGNSSCALCLQKFPSRLANLSRHLVLKHPETFLGASKSLDLSSEQFLDYVNYLKNQEINALIPATSVDGSSLFECPYCSVHLKTKKTARVHLFLMHAETLAEKVEKLQREIKPNDPKIKKPPVIVKPVKYCECGNAYSSRQGLQLHIKIKGCREASADNHGIYQLFDESPEQPKVESAQLTVGNDPLECTEELIANGPRENEIEQKVHVNLTNNQVEFKYQSDLPKVFPPTATLAPDSSRQNIDTGYNLRKRRGTTYVDTDSDDGDIDDEKQITDTPDKTQISNYCKGDPLDCREELKGSSSREDEIRGNSNVKVTQAGKEVVSRHTTQSGKQLNTCFYCGRKFKSFGAVQAHRKICQKNTTRRKNSSKSCSKRWKGNLKMSGGVMSAKHVLHTKHSKERKHSKSFTSSSSTCSICSKVFRNKCKLNDHNISMHIVNMFMSSKLKSVSIDQFKMYIFYLVNNGVKKSQQPNDNETSSRLIKFKCTICSKPLTSNRYARVHFVSQHRKILRGKLEKLQETMKPEELGKVPFHFRGRKRTTNSSLTSTSNVMDYSCSVCFRNFPEGTYRLRQHLAIFHPGTFLASSKSQHLSNEQFEVYVKYLQKQEAARFIPTTDDDKKKRGKVCFRCPYCSVSLVNKKSIRLHPLLVHAEILARKVVELQKVMKPDDPKMRIGKSPKKIWCSSCGNGYLNRLNFKKHIKMQRCQKASLDNNDSGPISEQLKGLPQEAVESTQFSAEHEHLFECTEEFLEKVPHHAKVEAKFKEHLDSEKIPSHESLVMVKREQGQHVEEMILPD